MRFQINIRYLIEPAMDIPVSGINKRNGERQYNELDKTYRQPGARDTMESPFEDSPEEFFTIENQ